MKIIRRIAAYLMTCIFIGFMIFDNAAMYAKADTILPANYVFVYNGTDYKSGSLELDMKSSEVFLNVAAINSSGDRTWASDSTVTWVSSEPKVVYCDPNTPFGSNFVKLVRKGPGYSTINAIIKQGTSTLTISFRVKVDLEFDYGKMGITTEATVTHEKVMIMNKGDAAQKIYLKYTDDVTGSTPATDSAISDNLVDYTSSNKGVATVENGYITAVGAGSTDITATSNTVSSKDNVMTATLHVVVTPTFKLIYGSNSKDSVDSYTEVNTGTATGVTSSFTIESNATLATNLTWSIRDFSSNTDPRKLSEVTKDKMTYTISQGDGKVTFNNVKAGTYDIYAFVKENYNENVNVPYAYMRVVVPPDIGDKTVIMNVNDTYSILDNCNIPEISDFNYVYSLGNENIALFDNKTGTITARVKGEATLQLTYVTGKGLFDNNTVSIPKQSIHFIIIDGIALSMTSAKMYTKGTLLLDPIVTDYTNPVTWSSSDPTVATVDSGKVTAGTKAGTVRITATQTVDGVKKSAVCVITVQASVQSITVDPSSVILAIDSNRTQNNYKTLHATVSPANLSGVSLKWLSSDTNVVDISESSALTATILAKGGGHAVISAINQDNVVVGYCHVTVNQQVEGITLNATSVTQLLSQNSYQLTASVTPSFAVNKDIKWTSTDPSKAKVDAYGLVTYVKPGTVSILATSVDNPTVRAICNFNIQIPAVSVALNEQSKTLYVGQTYKLGYTILPADASNTGVTWTSTNTTVATVDASGKVTAKKVGTTVIILKALDGGFTAYCTITVKSVATGVRLDSTELNLKSGQFEYLKAELSPTDSTDNDLTWESSDTKVAVVDASGKVTAKKAGTAIIMVKTLSGAVAYCKVNVTEAVDGLLLNYSDKTIYKGSHFQLKVSVSPTSATNNLVTWKSSNTKVATIDEYGLVKGIVGGTSVITCKTTDGGFQATCVVTVRELATSVKLNHSSIRIGKGKTIVLKATVKNETATNHNVKWSSSNRKVVTVNSKGKVTGLSNGHATITAKAKDGSGAEAECSVKIVNPVTSLHLNKSYILMMVGDSRKLKATIRPKNATYKHANWTSSDKNVAVVGDDGVVTAFKAGSTTIISSAKDSSGKKAICYIDVRDRVAATGITVADKSIVMVAGEQKVVQVSLAPSTSTDRCYWSTDNSSVAYVNKSTGKIIARSVGDAAVTVMTSSGKTAVITVTVIGLNVTRLRLEQYSEYTLSVEGTTSPIRWDVTNPKIAVVNNGVVSTRGLGSTTVTAIVNGRRLKCYLKVVKIKS